MTSRPGRPEGSDAEGNAAPDRVSDSDSGSPSTKPLPSALAFVGMGTTIAGCVALGVVLGILADDAFHTSPALLIVGLVLGVTSAVLTVVAQTRRYL
jgi:F0F1-type ATP synthase assembly protein I